MPSISPASPPACSRTRSPTLNGRAEISTTPAIRLPSVCWAARPNTTAKIAPDTASVARLEPGDPERDEHRGRQERQPDQEADGARRRGIHPPEQPGRERPPDVAREPPAEDEQRDGGEHPDGQIEPEDLTAVLVREQHAGDQRHHDRELEPRTRGAVCRMDGQRAGARGGLHDRRAAAEDAHP